MGELFSKFKDKKQLLYWRPVRQALHTSRMLVLPGFQGVPLFDVILFFVKGLKKGVINQRAASLSYHIFFSLFPLLLAGFTLLPFFHLEHYIPMILETLDNLFPDSTQDFIQRTVTDLLSKKHKGLMSIGFISSLWIASSGFNSLLLTFNQSANVDKKRKFIYRRTISIGMVFGIFVAVIISFTLIIFSRKLMMYLIFNDTIQTFFQMYIFKVIKWSIIVFLVYVVLATIYYITPANRKGHKFFSAGATLATVMFILMSNGFNFYILHFSRYNALYGSIGAIIIFLLWIYLNAYVLILGFELNASIAEAYREGHTKKKLEKDNEKVSISRTSTNMLNTRRIKAIFNRSKIKKIISKRQET